MVLGRLSLKAKLIGVIMLTSATGITLAGIGFGIQDARSSRKEAIEALNVTVDIAGANCAAALELGATADAQSILRTLTVHKPIITTAVYDAEGRLFASYRRGSHAGQTSQIFERIEPRVSQEMRGADLLVARQITSQTKPIGFLWVRADAESLGGRMQGLVWTTIIVLIGVGLIVWPLGAWLQRIISGPILHLSEVARTVTQERCYARRAERTSDDEVGMLIGDFNEMLAELQVQQATMEACVAERTRQLELANVKMRGEMERAEIAGKAKSQFLATMSHEIRTPMNAIIGMTEMALDTQLTDEQEEYLSIVRHSSGALLSIINDILDFSKVDAGRLELSPEPFDVRGSLGQTVRAFAAAADRKGVFLGFRVSPEIPALLVGDAGRLHQILTNLVGNALKFTEHGSVSVEVFADKICGGACQLRVSVQDTGIGIPEDKLDVVFESFAQVDGSTSRKFGGTGLGLAIAGRLASLMGGRVWVESEVGRGTRFQFTARLDVQDPAPPPPVDFLEGKQALIASCCASTGEVVEEMMRAWGMQTTRAMSREAALSLVDSEQRHDGFDLLVIDDPFGDDSGFELAEALRPADSCRPPALFIIRTAALPAAEMRSQHVPRDRHVFAPVLHSELLERARDILAAAEAPRQPGEIGETPTENPEIRVLVVEDNVANQKLVTAMLRKGGHEVTLAGDGQECIAILESRGVAAFEVILMDVQMPGKSGLETTEWIREWEAGRTRIPIIALTANAMAGDRERCLEAGMDHYLAKPVRRAALLETVARFGAVASAAD